jgi:hypothetical protein
MTGSAMGKIAMVHPAAMMSEPMSRVSMTKQAVAGIPMVKRQINV